MGDSLTDVFAYTVADSGGLTDSATLTVTINGANDAPVAVADTATAAEAGGTLNGTAGTDPTGNVLTNDTDIDGADTPATNGAVTFAKENTAGSNAAVTAGTTSANGLEVTGLYGTLTIGADGSYVYVVDNTNSAVQALDVGDSLTDVFAYTVADSGGLTDSATLTVTINGANDAPVAVADTATAAEAGGTLNGTAGTDPTGNVLTNDTDIDGADTPATNGAVTFAKENTAGSNAAVTAGTTSANGLEVTGLYGTLTIGADGSYVYVVDNTNSAVQALDVGDSLTDVFAYTVADSGGLTDSATLTVTINGANDAPVAVADTATAAEAGGTLNGTAGTDPTGNVLTNDTDIDGADTPATNGAVTFAKENTAGSNAAVTAGTTSANGLEVDGSVRHPDDRGRRQLRLCGGQHQQRRPGTGCGRLSDRRFCIHRGG